MEINSSPLYIQQVLEAVFTRKATPSMTIKLSMWQCLDLKTTTTNQPKNQNLKSQCIKAWKQFQFGVRPGFLCHWFHNPEKLFPNSLAKPTIQLQN